MLREYSSSNLINYVMNEIKNISMIFQFHIKKITD